ncbi:MAG: hypothetical protein AAF663_00715 [Planctomycetota bacterium]
MTIDCAGAEPAGSSDKAKKHANLLRVQLMVTLRLLTTDSTRDTAVDPPIEPDRGEDPDVGSVFLWLRGDRLRSGRAAGLVDLFERP